MKKTFAAAVFLLASALPLAAQQWSFGASTGPFVFGDFLERKVLLGTPGGPPTTQTITVSAETSPGLALDLERSFSDRWAVRAEGTFTRANMSVRVQGNGDGVDIDAGDMDVSTFMLPLVFRINPRGTFRFHLLGGPAVAAYRLRAQENSDGVEPAFEGTQLEYGVAFGGGVGWWFSDRFAIEANVTDTITTSPLDEEDFDDTPGIEIPRPHNAHGTLGVRWRF
ncbi:MAG TPA: hypothetical protein VF846_16275 [Thermoanaerobaculia bacterium]|jgi:hypothetical protein